MEHRCVHCGSRTLMLRFDHVRKKAGWWCSFCRRFEEETADDA